MCRGGRTRCSWIKYLAYWQLFLEDILITYLNRIFDIDIKSFWMSLNIQIRLWLSINYFEICFFSDMYKNMHRCNHCFTVNCRCKSLLSVCISLVHAVTSSNMNMCAQRYSICISLTHQKHDFINIHSSAGLNFCVCTCIWRHKKWLI